MKANEAIGLAIRCPGCSGPAKVVRAKQWLSSFNLAAYKPPEHVIIECPRCRNVLKEGNLEVEPIPANP
jgi:hypothetical protein